MTRPDRTSAGIAPCWHYADTNQARVQIRPWERQVYTPPARSMHEASARTVAGTGLAVVARQGLLASRRLRRQQNFARCKLESLKRPLTVAASEVVPEC